MKKRILLVAIMMLGGIMAGCQKEAAENKQDTSQSVDVDQLQEIDKNVDFGDVTFNSETDIQNSYEYLNELVSYKTGYFLFQDNEIGDMILKYYDREKGMILPVCSKADCKHTDENCDAYFSEDFSSELCYYEGNLYTIYSEFAEDGTRTDVLCQISLDGSRRKTLFELCTLKADDESGLISTTFKIHRGYVYYVYMEGETSHLFAKSLEDENEEAVEICTCSGSYAYLGDSKGYGDGIMFQTYSYNDESGDDVIGKVIYYSQKNNKLSLILEGNLGSFAICDGSLAYFDGTDIQILSMEDYESKVLVKNNKAYVSYDGKNIYVDNLWECDMNEDYSEHKVDVYNLDGNLIDSIPMTDNHWEIIWGDEYYLFERFGDDGQLYALDTNQIGTGKQDWILIESEQ